MVPAGVTSIQVECWGGGGSGGYRATSGAASGGGGAGWAKTNTLTVTPGQKVYYHVGAGGAAISGANLAGQSGENTWLNISANLVPVSTAEGCLASRGRAGSQGASVGGGASFDNGLWIGDAGFNGRNTNGAVGAGSATGGSGAATPLSLGNIASGTSGETPGGNAGTGGGAGGAAGGGAGASDVDGGGGGGGGATSPAAMGGDGGHPGCGGGGGITPATRSGDGGGGQIRITYTAALTAAGRRVAVVMM